MPRWFLLTAAATAVFASHAAGPVAKANALPRGTSHPLCVQVILHVPGHAPVTVLAAGCTSRSLHPTPPPSDTTTSPAPPEPTTATTVPSVPTIPPPGVLDPAPGSTSSVPAITPGIKGRPVSADLSNSADTAHDQQASASGTRMRGTAGTASANDPDAIGHQDHRLGSDLGPWGGPGQSLDGISDTPSAAARPWTLALVVLLVLLAAVVRRGRT